MKLIIPITLNCLLVAGVYIADRKIPENKLPYMARQIIIGILFGMLSAFASSCGAPLLGTVINVRDAAPLSAGLIFGAPAGIISGFIGGIYRWFSVYWGAGTYTRLACTIATIFAGFMAAGLRRLMFDDKKPTWGYGVCIPVVCEVIHMMIIFLTNMNDSTYAFEIVRVATLPMIFGNSLAVGLSIVIITLISRESLTRGEENENIARTFQRWLLWCIVVAYILTSLFTYFLQDGMASRQTQEMFTTAINDVKADVRGKSDEHILDINEQIVQRYLEDEDVSLDALSEEFGVIEINVVSPDGLVVKSTDASLAGKFDMKSTEQSAEFMVLTKGEKVFVQEYGPVGSDGKTMRKFAGMALPGGGYIQIGYSTAQFHDMLDGFVTDVTKNRHVGSGGFVAVCDENLNLITQNQYDEKHISSIGIQPDANMLAGKSAEALCEAEITHAESGYSEKHIYVYTFVEGYCIIAAMPKTEAMFMRDASLYTSMFMQILIFAMLFVSIYILIKRVIINNLRKINESLAQITNGNLDVTVNVRSNAEFAYLSDDINSTVATLKRYIAEAAAKIDQELEYAKQIQLSALPAELPGESDFMINATMIAAKEVGGDFYDYYRLDEHTIAFLAADVSGKGIPAAMFMMTAKTVLKDLAERGLEVDDIFTMANEKLCENNDSGMFVTAWMGILDIPTGRLQYANAGHNPPLILSDGKFDYLRSRAGFVLAGMEGVVYKAHEITLNPSDRILLYTDGVTEATDINEQLYGENRLRDFMNRNIHMDGKDILTALKSDIDGFVGDAPQFDDITMLIFDYIRNKGGNEMTEKIFPAKVELLDDVLGFVEEKLDRYGCAMKTTVAVCVAIEEIFVNIASYAYGEEGGDVRFTIAYEDESRKVTFEISDKGMEFDPLARPDPDITLSAEEREVGGLGIYITKKTMDSVSYRYENGENIITMIKTI